MKNLRKFLAQAKVLRENAKSTSLERHGVLWRDGYTLMCDDVHMLSSHEADYIAAAPEIQEKLEAMLEVLLLAYQVTGTKNRALTLVISELEQIAGDGE